MGVEGSGYHQSRWLHCRSTALLCTLISSGKKDNDKPDTHIVTFSNIGYRQVPVVSVHKLNLFKGQIYWFVTSAIFTGKKVLSQFDMYINLYSIMCLTEVLNIGSSRCECMISLKGIVWSLSTYSPA